MAATRTETDSFGPLEVPADRYWGAQTQRSIQNFPIGWETQPVELVRALGVIKQAAADVNMASGDLDPKLGEAIAAAAAEVAAGKCDDRVPAGGLADRLGHAVEHERQRGDLEPGDRDARRRDRLEAAGAPERPRQHEPVVERHLPDGDAHRGRGHRARRDAARAAEAARRAGRQGGGVQGHHQDRPHPYPGRDAADARPGVRRLCVPGRAGDQAGDRGASQHLSAGAGRHGGRHRAQHAGGLRRGDRRADRRDHRASLRHRAEQVRGAGGERRDGRDVGGAEDGGGVALQDRQRHPAARQRAAQRPRRTDPARERARLVDHAGQGEPDPGRGADDGLRPGDGQRRRRRLRRQRRAISSSTSTSR